MGRPFVIGLALLLGALVIGGVAYQAGVAAGLATAGTGVPAAMPYAYAPFGFGFGIFGLIFTILVVFLLFGAFRALLWGGPRHWGPGPGYRGDGPRALFEEWHRESHRQGTGERQGSGPASSA